MGVLDSTTLSGVAWNFNGPRRVYADYSYDYPPSKPNKQVQIIDIHDKLKNCLYYIGNENRLSINCLTMSILDIETENLEVHEMRNRISREYQILDALKDCKNETIVIFSGKVDNSAGYAITVYCLLTHFSKSFQSEFLDRNELSLRVRKFQLKFLDENRKLLLLGGKDPNNDTDQTIDLIYVIEWAGYREANITPWLEVVREEKL